MNPLVQLREMGQSPWYDYIRRGLITSGDLQALIEKDGLMGMTSNPSIFEKAIAGSVDYDEAIARVASQVTSVKQIYEGVAIQDIQDAADLMRPVYDTSDGRDGYVSWRFLRIWLLTHKAPSMKRSVCGKLWVGTMS